MTVLILALSWLLLTLFLCMLEKLKGVFFPIFDALFDRILQSDKTGRTTYVIDEL